MNYELLGKVMTLVLNDDYYEKSTVWGTKNSILNAVKHNKCLIWENSKKEVTGYVTYGFLTQKEIDTDLWNGDEMYARNEGEVLYFPKFQCRAGRRELIKFIRYIQKYIFKHYPHIATAGGLRVYPDGRKRNEKWHRRKL